MFLLQGLAEDEFAFADRCNFSILWDEIWVWCQCWTAVQTLSVLCCSLIVRSGTAWQAKYQSHLPRKPKTLRRTRIIPLLDEGNRGVGLYTSSRRAQACHERQDNCRFIGGSQRPRNTRSACPDVIGRAPQVASVQVCLRACVCERESAHGVVPVF